MCTAPVKGKARRGRRARDQVRGQRRQQMCCYKGQTPCSPRPGQRSAQKTEEKSQAQWRQNRGDHQGLGDGSGGKQPPERESRQRPPGWTEGATRGAASAQGPALTREPWRRLGPGDTKDPSRRELRRGPDPPPRPRPPRRICGGGSGAVGTPSSGGLAAPVPPARGAECSGTNPTVSGGGSAKTHR